MIVRSSGDEALIARIRVELEGSELEVTELDAQAGDLDAIARAEDAEAALRIESPSTVALWTARPIGDPNGTHDVIREPGASRHEQEVLVLRVVETLRALRLGVPVPQVDAARAAEAAAPEPAKPAPLLEPERPIASQAEAPPWPFRAPQLWLELAPALTLSPGGLGPQLQAQLGARYQPIAWLSIAGFALAPLWRGTWEAPEANADASTWIVGLGADAHYALRPLELSAGLGLAAVITAMSGEGTAELEGTEESERTAAPFARAALHLELAASLRLCLRALIGASVPEVSMVFIDREVATWGQPFVVVGLGVELPVIAHAASQ